MKEIKKHVKHIYSNKTEGNVFKRSRALSSTIPVIEERFDNVTKVVVRPKKNCTAPTEADENILGNDLCNIRPFNMQTGRRHPSFILPSNESRIT